MKQSNNSQFAVLSNGLIIKISNIVGIQPNTSNNGEYYVHTVTSQYYKINENDYTYLKKILSCSKLFNIFASGLIVRNDCIIGIQPTDKIGEYYVHTTTPQYYRIDTVDYGRFIGKNFKHNGNTSKFGTSDPSEYVETL